MTRRKLQKALNRFDVIKKSKELEVPAVLGFTVNGINTVEVGNRAGFVWARIRSNQNEVVQAFNDQVSPVYGLPVVLIRDETDRARYRVKSKDLGVYQNWNNTPYLPRHGNQHSFNPEGGGGGDVTFIYNRQFMPLAVHPSGSAGGGNVYVQQYAYYQNTQWKYAGGTGTASLLPYKPTGSSARMVLVYLDSNGNPQLSAGSTYFDSSITGNAAVLPYIPSLGSTTDIPLAAVRLVSGTNNIVWDNIYDLRPIIVSDGFIPTGTSGHIIQDDGTPLAQQTALNFIGSSFAVYNTGGATNVSGTFVGGGAGIPERSIPIYEDSVFRVTGTILNFTTNMDVVVSGSVAYISSTGGGTGSSGAPIDAEYIVTADDVSLSAEVTIPGLAGHSDRKSSGITGSISEEYDTTTTGLTWTASTPNTVNSDTKLPSHLYVKSIDSTERLGLMTFNGGYSGTFDARCKMSMMIDSISNDPFFGLIITDSGRTFRMTLGITSALASQQRYIGAFRFTGSSYTAIGSVWPYNQSEVYLRITRSAANLVSWYWSSDGIGWQLIGTSTVVFNTERIGFRSSSNPHEAFVDWLRAQP